MIQNIFDSLIAILGKFVPALQNNAVFLYLSALAISTLFFFLIREIVAWYWKVNKILALLEQIAINTNETNTILRYNSKQNSQSELLKKELAKDKAPIF